ncbi:hypothetical protein GCM10010216_54420 [Streptomyces flaveolus]|nr:hypothetical protein GCM10010216_54420 [Streptomyces flaveolus]
MTGAGQEGRRATDGRGWWKRGPEAGRGAGRRAGRAGSHRSMELLPRVRVRGHVAQDRVGPDCKMPPTRRRNPRGRGDD